MGMPTLRINPTIKDLLTKITAAEVVHIDGELYVITEKSKIADLQTLMLENNVEDFEMVFETDYHSFNWWEISCDSRPLDNGAWHIGDSVLSFAITTPV